MKKRSKSASETKRPKATDIQFYPEESTGWQMELDGKGGYVVHCPTATGLAEIARIQVNPKFTQHARIHIASLMIASSEMYQALRECLPHLAYGDYQDVINFGHVVALLRGASGKTPIDFAPDPDLDLMQSANREALELLAVKAGGK